jgi:hypothetical protein
LRIAFIASIFTPIKLEITPTSIYVNHTLASHQLAL